MIDGSQIFDGTLGSNGVPVGAALTTTRVSTNVLDLLVGRDLGADEPLGLHVNVLTALTGATSLQIDAEVCATVGGSYVAIILSPVIPVAQLIVGAPIFRYALPVNQVLNATAGILNAPGRYLRLNYTIVGTFGAGTIFSYINPRQDRPAYYTYPNNYTAYASPGEV